MSTRRIETGKRSLRLLKPSNSRTQRVTGRLAVEKVNRTYLQGFGYREALTRLEFGGASL